MKLDLRDYLRRVEVPDGMDPAEVFAKHPDVPFWIRDGIRTWREPTMGEYFEWRSKTGVDK